MYAKTRWNSIDAIKGISCIAVVFIHVLFPEPLKMTVKSISRFAVPVFFMTSGFFFMQEGTCRIPRTVKKIEHIARILAGSAGFYLLFCIIYNKLQDPLWNMRDFFYKRCTAGRMVRFFVTNDPFVYSHLWFLLALLYIYVFCIFCFGDGKRLSLSLPLGATCLFGYISLQEFGNVIGLKSSFIIPESEQRIYLFNLFVFRGLSFFLIGMTLRQYIDLIQSKKIPRLLYFFIFVFGCFLAPFEYKWTQDTQYFVGNILASLALMFFALQYPCCEIKGLIHIGRDLSMYVYILHIAVYYSVNLIISKFGISKVPMILWTRPGAVLILSLCVAEGIFNLKKRLHME